MLLQVPFLLFWFVPVAAFIIILYLLKIRRRPVRVPAIFLFPHITTDVRANALWQRLRFNWLMILQLIAVLLLLMALARPMIKGHGIAGQTVVFVLDASASMKASDVKPDRFAEAKRRIQRWLNDLSARDHAALIAVSTEPKVIAPLSTDHKRLMDTLERLRATDGPSDLGTALRLAVALVENRPNAQIVLISDGAFPEVADFSHGKAQFTYEAVGRSDENAGIVTMDAQRRGNRILLFVALRNFSKRTMKGVLNWFADGQLVNAHELSLPAQKVYGETLMLPASVRQVAVKWECSDDVLGVDNTTYWVGSGRQPVRVLIVGSGNFFLERALALEPETLVDKATEVPETERGAGTDGSYDVIIFDGTKPVPVKAKSVWLIGATDGNFVRHIGKVNQPTVMSWERDHPVLRFVDLAATLIDKALKVQVTDWAQVIAESKETPLMAVGERANKRWLFVGFNLLDSDFPLKVGFPIFVANALLWSIGERRWQQGFTLKAGTAVSLTLPTKTATLQRPDALTLRLNLPDQLLVLRETNTVGVYELRSGDLQTQFAVNLLNADESDIAPKPSITLGGRVYAAQTKNISWRELWRLVLLLALIILAIEWLVYVRQS